MNWYILLYILLYQGLKFNMRCMYSHFILRYNFRNRWQAYRQSRIWTVCWCCTENRWELPSPMHRREGFRLQGQQVSPHYYSVHVPGWRFHKWWWTWRQEHLWREVWWVESNYNLKSCLIPQFFMCYSWRELQAKAYQARSPVHGQRRPKHQRLAVLHHHCGHLLARWQACRLRRGQRRHGCREDDGVIWKR